jgi:D-arabinose 1-dehydrogenase-like Zn-dependent alcohol dehydrogenase
MTAMVLRADRSFGLERRPVPIPRDDQVLVDIDLCGICGSDLHAPQTLEVYHGGFIMGHEPVGRIARVGRDVIGWHVGQRVCVNPNGDTCGACEACRAGRLNHCIPATLQRAVGLQADGALATQVAVSPKTLHAVPDKNGSHRIRLGRASRHGTARGPAPPVISPGGRYSSSEVARSGIYVAGSRATSGQGMSG